MWPTFEELCVWFVHAALILTALFVAGGIVYAFALMMMEP